ncbi:hypothetical protein AMTRI_Chr12g267910 [Amborella trichopoda]
MDYRGGPPAHPHQIHPLPLHQPYHPHHSSYPNPNIHQPYEYAVVPPPLGLAHNGPHYSTPPPLPSQSIDYPHSSYSLRPSHIDPYAPMAPPTMNPYNPHPGFQGQALVPVAMPPNVEYHVKEFGVDPLASGPALRLPNGPGPNPFVWNEPNYGFYNREFPKKIKKTKVVQSVWCAICKIDCTSKDVLIEHEKGRKHLKNLNKLVEMANATNKERKTDPEEELEPEVESRNAKKRKRMKAAVKEALDTKKKKIMEGGAAADEVMECKLCGTVCNSKTVYIFHIQGKRHAMQVKKAAEKGK